MRSEIYAQLLKELRSGKKAVIHTVFSQGKGLQTKLCKRLVKLSDADDSAEKALSSGIPLVIPGDDTCALFEPFYPEERLIVLGCGHIAIPLVNFASAVGFVVTVVDDRPSFANVSRFPLAGRVICEAFHKALVALNVTQSDYVVIITRGHQHDQACLAQLLSGVEPFYTGMIGSKRRIAAVKDAMIEQGFDKDRLARLHSPIGLPIGGITPEEIALSIASELVACKRLQGASGQPSVRTDMDFQVLETLSSDPEPKAVVTVVETLGSVPRGAGAMMVVYPDGRTIGSIGGGCSEAGVILRACEIIGTGGYETHTVDLTGDAAQEEGMVCGGIMRVLIEDD